MSCKVSSTWTALASTRSLLQRRRKHLFSPTRLFSSIGVNSSQGSVLAWYSRRLDTHPVLTKAITSGLVSGGGDFLCQWLLVDHKLFKSGNSWWDRARTFRFAFLGCFLVTPIIHVWYGFLAKQIPGLELRQVAKRVACDQFLFAPVFIPLWFTSLWTLEGFDEKMTSPDHASQHSFRQRLMHEVPDIVVANWCLWIPALSINFRFVPVKYQVLYGNFIGLLWNIFVSFTINRPPLDDDADDDDDDKKKKVDDTSSVAD